MPSSARSCEQHVDQGSNVGNIDRAIVVDIGDCGIDLVNCPVQQIINHRGDVGDGDFAIAVQVALHDGGFTMNDKLGAIGVI